MESEAQIAERLKQNLPKAQPDTTTDRYDDANPADQGYDGDLGDAMDMYKMYDFFDVQPQFRSGENEQKIQLIYRWAAQQVQSTDYLRVAKLILDIEQGMGASTIGNRMERMYQYIKMENQMGRLREEQSLL